MTQIGFAVCLFLYIQTTYYKHFTHLLVCDFVMEYGVWQSENEIIEKILLSSGDLIF